MMNSKTCEQAWESGLEKVESKLFPENTIEHYVINSCYSMYSSSLSRVSASAVFSSLLSSSAWHKNSISCSVFVSQVLKPLWKRV